MKQLTLIGIFFSLALVSLKAQSASTSEADSATNKLDMVVVIKTQQTFTNSVGMEMKSLGGLWASTYEVTQDAYSKVTGANPSQFSGTNRPVDSVSWNNAMEFCKTLTALERKESNLPKNYAYALPTEAQWEKLVADAGLDNSVTSDKIRLSSTKPVGSLQPNSLGLYDTRGNVMEFTLDRHDPTQTYRVLRGGAYDTWFEANLRTEFRHYAAGPDDAKSDYGFRCVLVRQSPSSEN